MKQTVLKAAALLACLTLVFALASCGGSGSGSTTAPSETAGTTASPNVTGTAAVSLTCDKATVAPGEEFTVTLSFKDVTDTSGFIIFSDFNTELLEYVDSDCSGSEREGFTSVCGVTSDGTRLSFAGMTNSEKGVNLPGESEMFTVKLKLSEKAVRNTELTFTLTVNEYASLTCTPAYNGLTLTVA